MKWIILSLISIVFLSGCTDASLEQAQPQSEESSATEQTVESAYKGQIIAGDTTKYIRFNSDDYQKALSEGKAVYLYFYANWCPICRAERPNILQAFNEMTLEDAVGFEVHYNDNEVTDEEEKISRDFGISYQHTTVILNTAGKESFRSLSPISKDMIKVEINKASM
jgi:thiol-disulfide isomerase/thioredoxin